MSGYVNPPVCLVFFGKFNEKERSFQAVSQWSYFGFPLSGVERYSLVVSCSRRRVSLFNFSQLHFFFFFFKFATEKIRRGSFTRRAVKLFLEHKLYFSPKNDVAFNLKNTRKCPSAHVIQPHSSHEPSSTRAPLLPILRFFFPLETSINRCLRSHRRASPARTPLLFKMAYLPSLM